MFLKSVSCLILLVLLIQVMLQYRATKRGSGPVTHYRATVNWVLVVLLVLSIGLTGYVDHHVSTATNHQKSSRTASRPAKPAKPLKIVFPHHADLKNGQARVSFTVPEHTKMQIYSGKKELAVMDNTKKNHQHQFNYLFKKAGTYQVKATRRHQHFANRLTIRNHQAKKTVASSQQPVSSTAATVNNGGANNNNRRPVASNRRASTGHAASTALGYHYDYRSVKFPNTATTQPSNAAGRSSASGNTPVSANENVNANSK